MYIDGNAFYVWNKKNEKKSKDVKTKERAYESTNEVKETFYTLRFHLDQMKGLQQQK